MSGWQPIETAPGCPMSVMMWVPTSAHPGLLPGQDYSMLVGFWSHGAFREQGTGHDMKERLESWGGAGDYPTHWMPLPSPPEQST